MSSIQFLIIYRDILESTEVIHQKSLCNTRIRPHEVTHLGLFRLVRFVNWRSAINPVMTSFSVYCTMSHIDCESKMCVSIFLSEPNGTRLLLKQNEKENEHFFPFLFPLRHSKRFISRFNQIQQLCFSSSSMTSMSY